MIPLGEPNIRHKPPVTSLGVIMRSFAQWGLATAMPIGLAWCIIDVIAGDTILSALAAGSFLAAVTFIAPASLFGLAAIGLSGIIPRLLGESVAADRDKFADYYAIVSELAKQTGQNVPSLRVFTRNTPVSPVSLTYTWFGRKAAITIDPQILEYLSHGELKAVLAHEMIHLKNKDRIPSTAKEIEADRGAACIMGSGHPIASSLEKIDKRARELEATKVAGKRTFTIKIPRLFQFCVIDYHPPVTERARRMRGGDW